LCGFQGLQHLLQLEDLLMDHNELRDVAGLGDCKKLLGLHASDNHITTLAGLKGLQALEVGPRACIGNTAGMSRDQRVLMEGSGDFGPVNAEFTEMLRLWTGVAPAAQPPEQPE
jgi:hypothetical protein